MQVIPDPRKAMDAVAALRAGKKTIGFVPTMGALHEGHLSLVRASVAANDITAVSIFINPLQFGENEDLDRYPRDLEGDLRQLEAEEVDLVVTPTPGTMYPPGFCTHVEVEGMTGGLCGHFRPGHFRGVTTVVAKLFNIVRPDRAYFGQKDHQQSAVLRRMVEDLNMGIEVVVLPTVREADGLAMSSRNLGLSGKGRSRALALYQALRAAEEAFSRGERDAGGLLAVARTILDDAPGVEVQYLEVVDADTLESPPDMRGRTVLVAAAFVEGIRLIDNVILE